MNEKIKFPSTIVLGSTGSVGEQALSVAEKENIVIDAVSANKNYKRVEEQVRQFSCSFCAMSDESAAAELKVRLADTDCRVYSGEEGICEMISDSSAEAAVNSILGKAGLMPTISTLKSRKRLALANKESLVVAGDIVMPMAKEYGTEILPVDSEHCAIYQCLKSGRHEDVKKLILTASGGPFFGKKRDELEKIKLQDALAHPTWSMGQKITIDSATMMNKGFEVIEAAHLFGFSADKIDVVVQRESIIHSMVEYVDNSIIAQMSVPDMRFCVQYALTAPFRSEAVIDELDFGKLSSISFAKPDMDTFVLLKYALAALSMGGAVPCVLNAANEVAVSAFLCEKISFTDIFDYVSECVDKMAHYSSAKTLDEILSADVCAREYMEELISNL